MIRSRGFLFCVGRSFPWVPETWRARCLPYMGLRLERKCRELVCRRRGRGGQECPPYMELRIERRCRALVFVGAEGKAGKNARSTDYSTLSIARVLSIDPLGRRNGRSALLDGGESSAGNPFPRLPNRSPGNATSSRWAVDFGLQSPESL